MNWSATLFFDPLSNRPEIETAAYDVSDTGAAIHSPCADLSGNIVGILLRPTGKGPKAKRLAPLTAVARVISTVATPDGTRYRHGLSFVRPNEDITRFAKNMDEGPFPTFPARTRPSIAPSAANDPAAVGHAAKSKPVAANGSAGDAGSRTTPRPDLAASDALRRVLDHLGALAETLDTLNPAYPSGHYVIPGVPEFRNLVWAESRVGHTLSGEGAPQSLVTGVWFTYRLSANTQLRIERDYPEGEQLRKALAENRIDFTKLDKRNAQGGVTRSLFLFPCEVTASIVFEVAPNGRDLVLKMRNVGAFGDVENVLSPDRIDAAALDRLVAHVLAESTTLPPLAPSRGHAENIGASL